MSKQWTSVFETKVYRDGKCVHSSLRRNARTTKADWRSGLDWQSKVMGGDAAIGAASTGTATTAPTSTTVTLDGVGAPGGTTAYAGHIITMGACYAVCLTNTNVSSPVITIDKWYDPTNPGGSAAATPAAGRWVLLPGNAPGEWLALTADNAAVDAANDVTLASEISTGGGSRALGTYSHTSGATSYQLQKVFTFTSTFTINKEAVFAAASGGPMPFESLEPNPPTVVSGDQLTQTVTGNI